MGCCLGHPGIAVSVLRDVRHLPAAFLKPPEGELADAVGHARPPSGGDSGVCSMPERMPAPARCTTSASVTGCAEQELGVIH